MAVLPKYNCDFTNFIESIIKRPMLSPVATHSTATAYLRLILMGSKTRGRIWTRVWRTFPWSHQFDEARQLPKAESAFSRIFPHFSAIFIFYLLICCFGTDLMARLKLYFAKAPTGAWRVFYLHLEDPFCRMSLQPNAWSWFCRMLPLGWRQILRILTRSPGYLRWLVCRLQFFL